jgi:hypothetical protein
LSSTIETHPSENSNWRKHKNACPHYRERWFPGNDIAAGEPMYQVFCMQGTPPITLEEQERCLRSKTCCWRLTTVENAKKKAADRKAASESETTPTPSPAHP